MALTALAVLFGVFGQPLLAAVALIVAAAALGFLYHNKPPATIFMGDTGSLLLGYVLAVLPMAGTFHADPLLALAIPGLVVGLPVLDTALTIFRRIVQRRAICAPDGQHIHHRLKRKHGDRRAVWTLYGVGDLVWRDGGAGGPHAGILGLYRALWHRSHGARLGP